MPTRNVNLTEHYDSFIADRIKAGRYGNASEAVRAGLQLLERQEQEEQAKVAWLRDVTQNAFAALDRGEGISLNSPTDIDALVDEAVAEVRAARVLTRG